MNHHRTYRPERDGMGGAQLWWVGGGLWVGVAFGFAPKNGVVFNTYISSYIDRSCEVTQKALNLDYID